MKKVRLWLKTQASILGDVCMGFGVSVIAGEYSQLMRGEAHRMTFIVVISAAVFVAFGAILRNKNKEGK